MKVPAQKENPFWCVFHHKGMKRERLLLFFVRVSPSLRVEFDPIGWIGLPPEDTLTLE
jgi:hypothetical protein